MKKELLPSGVLLAEDDADDRLMISRALSQAGLDGALEVVRDGVELLDYLRGAGEDGAKKPQPWPKLILLDLNMPRLSGREALLEIKQDPTLQSIPIVILTTSSSPNDIAESYAAGANAYLTKPSRYSDLAEVAEAIVKFWCRAAELPVDHR